MTRFNQAMKTFLVLFTFLATTVSAQQISEIFIDAAPHFTYHFRGIYGLFGPGELLQRVNLYKAPSSEACEPFEFRPPKQHADEKFVLFVMRGGTCTYLEKVKNCQAAGASGVLVGNFALNQIMFMNGNGTADVPSVSVTGETVIAISSLMRKHDVKISFLPGPDLLSLQKGFLLMMVNTLVILLFFGASMGMFSFIMWYKRTALERRLLREAEEVKRLAREKVEAIVNSLDVGVYEKPDKDDLECGNDTVVMESGETDTTDSAPATENAAYDDEADCCAICLEEMEAGDQIRVLPLCVHGANFHLMCLDQWLMDVQSCPMCKARLTEEESESEESDSANISGADSSDNEGQGSSDDEDVMSGTMLTQIASSTRTSGSTRDTELGHVMSSHFLNSNDAEDVAEEDSEELDDSGDGYVRQSHLVPANDITEISVSGADIGDSSSRKTTEGRTASASGQSGHSMELRTISSNITDGQEGDSSAKSSDLRLNQEARRHASLSLDDEEREDDCDADEQTKLV